MRANSLITILCTLRAFKLGACEFADHILELLQLTHVNSLITDCVCLKLLKLTPANSLITLFCVFRAFKLYACEFADYNTLYA